MKSQRSQNALALAVGALALAILTSGTAVAATGQLVNVVDASTGTAAKVYGGGALRVGDGYGPMTVDGQVAVNGPITVLPGQPGWAVESRPWQAGRSVSASSTSACVTFDEPPAGTWVRLRSAFASTAADSGISEITVSGAFDAGSSTPLLHVPLSALTNGKWGTTDLDLVYAGYLAGGGTGQLESLSICYARSSSATVRTLNVVLTGELVTAP